MCVVRIATHLSSAETFEMPGTEELSVDPAQPSAPFDPTPAIADAISRVDDFAARDHSDDRVTLPRGSAHCGHAEHPGGARLS